MINMIEKVSDIMTSTEGAQRNTRSLLNQGVMILYVFSGFLFMEEQYTIAVCSIVVALGLGYIREIFKDYIEYKRNGDTKNTQ